MTANPLRTSSLCTPDSVPTPMTSASTSVLSEIVGPSISIPRAMFCVTSSEFDPLNASFAKMPAFDKSISSKKKKIASLSKTKAIISTRRPIAYSTTTTVYSLHVGDIAFQKVYDARRENERREDGEKNCETCESREKRRNGVKVNSFTFRRNFLNETRLGKWDSCVNSRSRWRLLTHSSVHQSQRRAGRRERETTKAERKKIYFRNTNFSFCERLLLFLLFIHKSDRKPDRRACSLVLRPRGLLWRHW